ncbi:death-associated protein 1-like [Oppia nitens]|uniref:death-associated protein 1-like n=1 Tax=Oppia nitens TaxID=1686743 RepID=UPI0023DC15AA|nr:death-associated protein 1-like [Oppia nitens]
MSSTDDNTTPDLKGGHPPAVKAGGMRITQHKTQHNEKPPTAEAKKETDIADDNEDELLPEVDLQPKPSPLVISGAVARGDGDFPTASVKAFHEKTPQPTNDFRATNSKPNIIHQPRK